MPRHLLLATVAVSSLCVRPSSSTQATGDPDSELRTDAGDSAAAAEKVREIVSVETAGEKYQKEEKGESKDESTADAQTKEAGVSEQAPTKLGVKPEEVVEAADESKDAVEKLAEDDAAAGENVSADTGATVADAAAAEGQGGGEGKQREKAFGGDVDATIRADEDAKIALDVAMGGGAPPNAREEEVAGDVGDAAHDANAAPPEAASAPREGGESTVSGTVARARYGISAQIARGLLARVFGIVRQCEGAIYANAFSSSTKQ